MKTEAGEAGISLRLLWKKSLVGSSMFLFRLDQVVGKIEKEVSCSSVIEIRLILVTGKGKMCGIKWFSTYWPFLTGCTYVLKGSGDMSTSC